jgi:hypothetical protein
MMSGKIQKKDVPKVKLQKCITKFIQKIEIKIRFFKHTFEHFQRFSKLSFAFVFLADLSGSVGGISDLKPKGTGFESRIRQGYICWWSFGSKTKRMRNERQPLWI